jgi:hypothetical protein
MTEKNETKIVIDADYVASEIAEFTSCISDRVVAGPSIRQAEEFLKKHERNIKDLVDDYIAENFPDWYDDELEGLKEDAAQAKLDSYRGK